MDSQYVAQLSILVFAGLVAGIAPLFGLLYVHRRADRETGAAQSAAIMVSGVQGLVLGLAFALSTSGAELWSAERLVAGFLRTALSAVVIAFLAYQAWGTVYRQYADRRR